MGRPEGAEEEEGTETLNAISGAIIGAAIKVHKALGPGLLEFADMEACAEVRGPHVAEALQYRFLDKEVA